MRILYDWKDLKDLYSAAYSECAFGLRNYLLDITKNMLTSVFSFCTL